MLASEAIADLDAALAENGEDIILRRVVGTANQVFIDVPCRAFARGYAPQQLVGGITQTDLFVILSPTQIDRAQWPGGQPPSVNTDPRVPNKNRGDRAKVRGVWRMVEAAQGICIGPALVRIEMRVVG
jgi:hypothetical protein